MVFYNQTPSSAIYFIVNKCKLSKIQNYFTYDQSKIIDGRNSNSKYKIERFAQNDLYLSIDKYFIIYLTILIFKMVIFSTRLMLLDSFVPRTVS